MIVRISFGHRMVHKGTLPKNKWKIFKTVAINGKSHEFCHFFDELTETEHIYVKRNYFLGVLVNPSRVTLAPLQHWLLVLSLL